MQRVNPFLSSHTAFPDSLYVRSTFSKKRAISRPFLLKISIVEWMDFVDGKVTRGKNLRFFAGIKPHFRIVGLENYRKWMLLIHDPLRCASSRCVTSMNGRECFLTRILIRKSQPRFLEQSSLKND